MPIDDEYVLRELPIMEVIIIFETCMSSYAYCKYQLWIGLKDNNDVIITLETDNNNVDIPSVQYKMSVFGCSFFSATNSSKKREPDENDTISFS